MKKNLDITKPRSSEQILAVPWLFVMSRAHCTNWGHSFYVSYWSWDQARRTRHSPRLARKAPIMQATITWAGPARIRHFYIEIGNNAHEQCVMYRSNRSFNMPPRATPRAFDFFENYCSNCPLPGPKCRSNAPHWCPFRWSNAPTPGTFHRHKNDRRTAETPSVVEQNLYKYSITKTEKHC